MSEGERFVKLPVSVMARRGLPPMAKLVFAAIGDRIGGNGRAWPSLRRLACDLGTDCKAVLRALAALQAAGLLTIEAGGKGRSNTYRLAGVGESPALTERQRWRNAHCGVGESPTKALANRPRNQTQPDPLNQSKGARLDDWALAQQAMTGGTLRTEAFRAAWERWVKYRRELGKGLKPSTITMQIRKLEEMGHADALAAIDQSIGHGWTGLFPPRGNTNASTNGCRSAARISAPPDKYANVGRTIGASADAP